ncbi:helix-turn-helix domain-containing protein [Candidatus Stoquefichus massiliensis]|uniref:helix-turn-helix domain-containing protein n=1 Tax=Candidatus Stoquefichus massiliensis TaxID=1470350 RepID=UPI000482E471|nr:helix-turn-helix transcriptional regulator [Candidatus Stoquefichus massiliensis]
MSVSKQLIHLRNVKGISQEELASLMSVTRQAVSKWETDQSLPDSDKIIRLSEIFGVTTDYLLKGKESDPMDIYSQHSSKAGADMSIEVSEILENVHQMTTIKRYLIGTGIFIFVIAIMMSIIIFLKM